MDDGSYSTNKQNYYLHTQGFQLKDIEKLRNTLFRNFSIKSNIHRDRDKYKLYILKECNELLKKTIEQYIQPSFFYKLHSSLQDLQCASHYLCL